MKRLAAVLLVGACASTPKPPPPPATGSIAVFNTTDRCLRGRRLTISVDGRAKGEVEAGATATYTVLAGNRRLTLGADSATISVAKDATVRRAIGCGHVETVGGPNGAPLRLSVGAHACTTGPHGVIDWRLDGHALARQLPGSAERVVRVPPGPHRLEATLARKVITQARVTLSKGTASAHTAGCSDARANGLQHPSLYPLTVYYAPEASCTAPLQVRLAGKDLTLAPGSAYTVYVPAGRHEVQLAGGQRETRTLKTAGSVVRRAQCIESFESNRARKTPP